MTLITILQRGGLEIVPLPVVNQRTGQRWRHRRVVRKVKNKSNKPN